MRTIPSGVTPPSWESPRGGFYESEPSRRASEVVVFDSSSHSGINTRRTGSNSTRCTSTSTSTRRTSASTEKEGGLRGIQSWGSDSKRHLGGNKFAFYGTDTYILRSHNPDQLDL